MPYGTPGKQVVPGRLRTTNQLAPVHSAGVYINNVTFTDTKRTIACVESGQFSALVTSLPSLACLDCYFAETWVWDINNKSPDVMLSQDRQSAYFHTDPVSESTGTAGVRGTKAFTSGHHYWEIMLTEPAMGTSMMVGVGTDKALLHTSDYQFVNLLGLDEQSWGLSYKGMVCHGGKSRQYCQPFFEVGTVIGVHLNLYQGTLTFYKNGENLGVAFTGLNVIPKKLYPLVSSTAACTEVELQHRVCSYSSLEEECYLAVNRAVKRKADMDFLPLPKSVKNHLKLLR